MMAKMKTFSCAKLLTLLALSACVSNCQRISDHDTSVSTIKSRNDSTIFNSAIDDEKTWRTRHHAKRRSRNNEERRDGWNSWIKNNFIVTDSLSDGEKQIRVHVDGTFAKQTSAIENGDGIILRQLTDGHQFVQMIYSAQKELLDCEYVDKKSSVKKFIKTFRKEIMNYNGSAYKKRRKQNNGDCSLSYSAKWKCKKNRKNKKAEANEDLKEFFIDEDYANYDDDTKNHKKQLSDSDWTGDEFMSPIEDEDFVGRRNKRGNSNQRSGEFIESLKNITVRILDNAANLPQDIADWIDVEESKKHCDAIHASVYKVVDKDQESESTIRRFRRSQESLMIMPGTLWCGKGHLANSYADLGPMSKVDSCCRVHDHCPIRISSMEHLLGTTNVYPYTISHCGCDIRRSRVARSTVLFPGTKWCGKGSAGSRNELGEFGAADRCCRLHDSACPFWVDAMAKKYGMFNYRPNTLMHCRCDERFRTCLKLANTDVSNMVGRLFFNIVQTKCFVLKPVKVCKERSWWGKCTKKAYKKQAHLRDNLSY